MVPFNLKVLAKLDECSLARTRKIFATARMLGFSLKFHGRIIIICILEKKTDTGKKCFPCGKVENIRKHARTMNVSGKSFLVLLKFTETDRPEFSPR